MPRKQGFTISHSPTNETTYLSPSDEQAFINWTLANRNAPGISEWNHPDQRYDYRGFWKYGLDKSKWKPGEHFPDTWKQHGHPYFSSESQYSRGPQDGGNWIGDTLIKPPLPSHQNENKRIDGSLKGPGYLGTLSRPDGGISTELSAGVGIDGEELNIPLLVPTLTRAEVNYLLNNGDVSKMPNIMSKAVDFAMQRRSTGKPYFATIEEMQDKLKIRR